MRNSVQNIKTDDQETQNSYWPTFPRLLPKHFENVLHISQENGINSNITRYFIGNTFLSYLPGASPKDTQIFSDYLKELTNPKLIEALTLLRKMKEVALNFYIEKISERLNEFISDATGSRKRRGNIETCNSGVFQVLYFQDHIVAFVHIAKIDESSVYGKYFYARPETQKSGKAIEFLKETVNSYLKKGITFDAIVWQNHPIWHIYQNKIGFKKIGETSETYPGSGLTFFKIRAEKKLS